MPCHDPSLRGKIIAGRPSFGSLYFRLYLPVGATTHRHQVAAGILPAVEGGILPPGSALEWRRTAIPPGKMPGSTAGRMPAATLQGRDAPSFRLVAALMWL